MRRLIQLGTLSLLPIACPALLAGETTRTDPAAIEFFEREIRPLLVAKCQSCHGEKKVRGGLRLTGRSALLKGGDSGPALVPGKPEQSLITRAVGYEGDLKMPPTGKLSDREITKLKRWVAQGAPWPDAARPVPAPPGEKFEPSEAQRRWWAYQPVRPVTPPNVANASWARTEIDRFILAELEKRGMAPARPADRRTLLRRASFDLTGLPPTPEEVEAFSKDDAPDAFAKVVDRLLASPAYGQRWGRHWLDVVRYADYHDGNPTTRTASCEPLNAWRYRDWVVVSLNRDLPFDQFIVHQIAGDLLPSPEGKEIYTEGLIATTFLTNGSWDRGDADKEKMVSDMVDDQIDTTGKAFLGLTLGCARCHNHKFDPLSQTDYYALAGIFYSTRILKELGAKGAEYTLNRVPLVSKAVVAQRAEQLKSLSQINARLAEFDKKSPKPAAADRARLLLVKQRDRMQAELLPEPPVAEAAQEGGTPGGLFPKIQDVPLHIRGSYTRLGPVVPRRMPQFFAGERQPKITAGSGRRELANWVASRDNPLTARVIVNRIWQGHFGAGIVRTPNNFGMLSEPPSHPALLDWLAAKFVEDGWSLKRLHRRILLSATYQQSSVVGRDQLVRDPENRWLARFTARRLEAEAIRDAMLFVSGRLDPATGGPAAADLNTTRRSLYVQTARWDRSTFAMLFDAANPDASEEKRTVSTVAPQALFLLNNDFALVQAKQFMERLIREVPMDETARMQRAFHLLFGRPANAEEMRIAWQIVAPSSKEGAGTAWRDFAHVLLCSNEFVYLD
ncbi:MAG: PSD1 domain-containing protein [Planctomycetes bacterium]|nr:PSD1 domain-containing protein [Planctomycetota bacterium]